MYKAIIFDFNGTLFDSISSLSPGAKELLDFCKEKGLKMGAVTMGAYDATIIHHLELDQYIETIRVVDTSKSPTDFEFVCTELGVQPSETIGVGDQVTTDTRCMNMAGGITIWLSKGKGSGFSASNPDERPDHMAKDLNEVKEVVVQLLEQGNE